VYIFEQYLAHLRYVWTCGLGWGLAQDCSCTCSVHGQGSCRQASWTHSRKKGCDLLTKKWFQQGAIIAPSRVVTSVACSCSCTSIQVPLQWQRAPGS
jgi:hypothetical protein